MLDTYVKNRADRKSWTSVPGCFARHFEQYGCAYKAKTEGFTSLGWCSGNPVVTTLASFLGVPGGYQAHRDGNPLFKPVTYYMDKNCNYTKKTENNKVCGFAGVSWSPVSLVFDAAANLNEGMTVVPFSVDPRYPKAFSLWKASSGAPLLVYDPRRTGQVTSARQLFGNYTFGGRSSTPTTDESAQLGEPWAHGYEALGTLDADHDGKISGDELNPLSLWFDTDRYGVSDEGEVAPVHTHNVRELYYQNPTSSEAGRDVHLSRGFKRIVDGEEVLGASIDWYAETFTNEQEASEALRAKLLGAHTQQPSETLPSDPKEDPSFAPFSRLKKVDLSTFKPHLALNHANDLSGYWMWTPKESDGDKHPGFLVFEQEGESIHGFSIIEALLSDNSEGLQSVIRIVPAAGEVSTGPNGGKTISFKLFDANGEVNVSATATISASGTVLEGTTIQRLTAHNGGATQSVETSYSWRAEKFINHPSSERSNDGE